MKRLSLLTVVLLVFISSRCFAQQSKELLVKEALYNYIDAFYKADTTKANKSVARDLAKRGYYNRDGNYIDLRMTYSQLVNLAQNWNKRENITGETLRKVHVFEVLDQTASAKVEAKWGIDYVHLAKINGTWTIVNVLWQSHPSSTNKN